MLTMPILPKLPKIRLMEKLPRIKPDHLPIPLRPNTRSPRMSKMPSLLNLRANLLKRSRRKQRLRKECRCSKQRLTLLSNNKLRLKKLSLILLPNSRMLMMKSRELMPFLLIPNNWLVKKLKEELRLNKQLRSLEVNFTKLRRKPSRLHLRLPRNSLPRKKS